MLGRIANMAGRHPRRVVAITVALAVIAGAFGGDVGKHMGPYGADDPASQSTKVSTQLNHATGLETGSEVVALITPATRSKAAQAERVLHGNPAIGSVASYWSTNDRAMLSRDGRSTYVVADFKRNKDGDSNVDRVRDRLTAISGVTVGGGAIANRAVNKIVEHDLVRAEMLAFPLLFLLSFWFFRSLVAALLPPLVGGLAIVFTFLALQVVNDVSQLSVFAINLVAGLGLGLAIDWSLFMVSRYREEMAAGRQGRDALQRTVLTAGRTVLFSSLTVAAALASLLVFPQKFLRSMGVGGVLIALIAATVTLVVLPSILSLLGTRVNALAPKWLQRAADSDARPATAGFWYRLSRFVMRRPARVAISSAALLIALGLPFLGVKFIAIDATALPKSQPPRQVDTALRTEFPPNPSSAIVVAASTPAGPRAQAFAQRARSLPGVAGVTPPRPISRNLTEIDVISKSGGQSEASQRLVKDLRALPAPFHVGVTG